MRKSVLNVGFILLYSEYSLIRPNWFDRAKFWRINDMVYYTNLFQDISYHSSRNGGLTGVGLTNIHCKILADLPVQWVGNPV